MNLTDFIKNFAEQFEVTDESEFKADTIYQDLDEWSSMTALAIIAMVNENFNETLTSADFKRAKTIEDLYNLVKSKQ